jgi:hypothetical protein
VTFASSDAFTAYLTSIWPPLDLGDDAGAGMGYGLQLEMLNTMELQVLSPSRLLRRLGGDLEALPSADFRGLRLRQLQDENQRLQQEVERLSRENAALRAPSNAFGSLGVWPGAGAASTRAREDDDLRAAIAASLRDSPGTQGSQHW